MFKNASYKDNPPTCKQCEKESVYVAFHTFDYFYCRNCKREVEMYEFIRRNYKKDDDDDFSSYGL